MYAKHRLVWHSTFRKPRLLFKTGFFSSAALMHDTTVLYSDTLNCMLFWFLCTTFMNMCCYVYVMSCIDEDLGYVYMRVSARAEFSPCQKLSMHWSHIPYSVYMREKFRPVPRSRTEISARAWVSTVRSKTPQSVYMQCFQPVLKRQVPDICTILPY